VPEIKIDPEEINRIMAEVVLGSTIGAVVKKRCQDFVKDYRFKDVVDDAIKTLLKQSLIDILNSGDYAERTRKIVEEKITDEAIKKVVDAAFRRAF
jgi:hypothetical protein